MSEPLGEPNKQQQEPRFEPPIGIVEVVLVGLLLYAVYQLFVKEDQRGSRFNANTEVAAIVIDLLRLVVLALVELRPL